ncbi:MAG: hypothetical protein AMXMBFR33_44410 [Candidatus Xenobia bacterium]
MSSPRVAVLLVLGVLVLALVGWQLRPAPAVDVVLPREREVVELILASGRLRAVRQSQIGCSVSGSVARVLVEEGDQVRKGQLLLQLDDRDILAQRDQARHAVETASSELARVERGAQPEEIARARAELEQASQVNRARLEQARQRLDQLERGGRPEERGEARANLARGRSEREQADRDLARARDLFAQGAISRSELEQATLAQNRALASERALQERLRLASRPARSEEIAAARAELEAARATLSTSEQVASQNLSLLARQPYPEDRSLARARLAEAESAFRNAVEQVERRQIRAPMAGLITRRYVEPGQSVNTGTTLLTLAAMERTEIYVETDETNLPRLKVGQSATVFPPAFREQPFTARVSQIGPDVDATRGVVPVRLKPDRLPDYARPEMTLDVSIEVQRLKALSLPLSCLINDNTCLVVEGGRLRALTVKVLARGQNWAAIEGLGEDQAVVQNATAVESGQRARARTVEPPELESGPPAVGNDLNGKTNYEPVGE